MNPCSYRHSDGKELGAVSGEEDLQKMWQQLTDGRLTLCCQVRGLSQASLLCWTLIQSLLRLSPSMMTFSCRTRTPTQADLSSIGCWLSTHTSRRDRGTWSSARETCWTSSPKVALQSCPHGCTGPGFWRLLWEGLGSRWPLQCSLRRYRLVLGFAQS